MRVEIKDEVQQFTAENTFTVVLRNSVSDGLLSAVNRQHLQSAECPLDSTEDAWL